VDRLFQIMARLRDPDSVESRPSWRPAARTPIRRASRKWTLSGSRSRRESLANTR